ncbi:hypothetical protein SNEBB_004693 [Seison nebaliae]|nr:hypothetical protein SNEBB_004693 [Seison nebaliae]
MEDKLESLKRNGVIVGDKTDKEFYTVNVDTVSFTILRRYQNVQCIGKGAQGVVVKATDVLTGQDVAIKKLLQTLDKEANAKRAYRELAIISTCTHKNVVTLLNAFTPQTSENEMRDVYLVMELIDANLSQVDNQKLSHEQYSYLLYQLLCGINHLHAAGIIHRDLKPTNIAITKDCSLKLLDFGLARTMHETVLLTPYVVTRYYRAPEVIVGMPYSKNVDIWSVGCIFAEKLLGKILFAGDDHIDQWKVISSILGSPDEDFLSKLSPEARRFIKSLGEKKQTDFNILFPDSCFPTAKENFTADAARDFLKKSLSIDPAKRMSVKEAIQHPYVNCWYEDEEFNAQPAIAYDVPNIDNAQYPLSKWRHMIFEMITNIENRETNSMLEG